MNDNAFTRMLRCASIHFFFFLSNIKKINQFEKSIKVLYDFVSFLDSRYIIQLILTRY